MLARICRTRFMVSSCASGRWLCPGIGRHPPIGDNVWMLYRQDLAWRIVRVKPTASASSTRTFIQFNSNANRGSSEIYYHSDDDSNNNNNISSTSTSDNDNDRTTDYFALLHMPRIFSLDQNSLQQQYRRIMAQVHPDRQRAQQQQQQQKQQQQQHDVVDPAIVTHAYQVLRQPHLRATYLLQLEGHPMPGHDDNAKDDNGHDAAATAAVSGTALVDAAFLMHIMEIRQEIELATLRLNDGSENNNTTTNNTNRRLEQLWHDNSRQIVTTCEQLDAAFQNQEWEQAHQLTAQLQYWTRIDEALRELLQVRE